MTYISLSSKTYSSLTIKPDVLNLMIETLFFSPCLACFRNASRGCQFSILEYTYSVFYSISIFCQNIYLFFQFIFRYLKSIYPLRHFLCHLLFFLNFLCFPQLQPFNFPPLFYMLQVAILILLVQHHFLYKKQPPDTEYPYSHILQTLWVDKYSNPSLHHISTTCAIPALLPKNVA